MKTQIIVHGKSQSRTALGIVNAYLKLFPDSTLADLQQAFPKSLNRTAPSDNIIVPIDEATGYERLFFEQEDEQLVLKDETKLVFVEIWTKEDFEAICEHAKQYGIEAIHEETKPFEKGSFELEYLEDESLLVAAPPLPAIEAEKKCKCKCKWWWWLLLVLLILLLLWFFLCKNCCCCKKSCEVKAPIENITPPADLNTADGITELEDAVSFTLPDGTAWTIDKNSAEYKLFASLQDKDKQIDADPAAGWIALDKVRFNSGKAEPDAGSAEQLKNVAAMLKFFPNAHIKIGGYTDNTGTEEVNRRISTERAKITADKLIALGIDKERVTSQGYGPASPVCPANDTEECRAKNRRVDIRLTQK